MVNYVHSIEQVETVFDTGDKPLLVHCNDFNYYVTKYNTTGAASNSLFREYINASFLQLWQLQTPAFAFVQLEEHHRPQSRRNIKHAIPCFGTLYNNELREVDAFISTLTPAQKKKYNHPACRIG